jgi:hypothetical protein
MRRLESQRVADVTAVVDTGLIAGIAGMRLLSLK